MPILRYDFGRVYVQLSYGSQDDGISGRDSVAIDGEPPENPVHNIIYAGNGNDFVRGGFGQDALFGGNGNDTLLGYGSGPGNPSSVAVYPLMDLGDLIDGGAGDDYLGGGGGGDILIGGSGNDTLVGSSGRDILYGGTGDDILRPGSDADILWGGAGADTFVYTYTVNQIETPDASGGRDIIMDFAPGEDTLDLRGYGVSAAELTTTALDDGLLLSFDFFGTTPEIELRGVAALQEGDILFA